MKCSAQESVLSENEDEFECRICRGGAEIGPLLHPCKCAGSIRYVHQECLDSWLARTNSAQCELCHQIFNFSPVYAPNTPEVLSAPVFVIGVVKVGAKKLVLVLRVIAVVFLWVLCLPVGTSWICRLYFLRSFNGLFRLQQRLQLGALISDWMQGVLLSMLVVTVFLAVSGLRDYMQRQEGQIQQQENRRHQNNAQNQFPAEDHGPDANMDHQIHAERVDEGGVGRWGGQEQPAHVDEALQQQEVGTADEVSDSDGVVEEQEPGAYHAEAVNQDLLRQQHLLQLQQRIREQQALLVNARQQQLEAEAVAAARDAARAVGEEEQRRVLDGDDMLLGFLDAREEELPLEEFVGLHGPARVMFENVLTALISNALSIGLMTLMPFTLGRLVLWLKHNWHLLLPGRMNVEGGGAGAGKGGREVGVAYYSDAVTLVIGYAALLLLTLKVLLLSLLLGHRQRHLQWLSPQSPVMRQVLTVLRYIWILCKVGVLLLIELVAFPMGCGWWLDMCSLDVIGASWVERLAFVRRHMLLSHFLHWAIGVAFMIHVAVLVAVLREVVRPEVLWFLRNPEEAIEHPLRDLIDEPVPKHVRRITLCLILYLPLTFVLVYLPLTAARMLAPDGMFPLHISLDTVSDVPSEVVLLHVSLPFLMEHFRPRNSFKKMLECWIDVVGTWLGLRNSLLPPREQDNTLMPAATPPGTPHTMGGGYVADDERTDSPEASSEEAEGMRMWGRRVVPHRRRKSNVERGLFMLMLAGLSIALVGGTVILMSLSVGRGLLGALVRVPVKHDVYAFGFGFCLCSTALEIGVRLYERVQTQQVWIAVGALCVKLLQIAKCAVGAVVMGAAGMLLGVLMDLVLIVPLRVPLHQSPELVGIEQWMGGVLILKLGCRILMDTPSLASLAPRLRHSLLEISQRGWRNFRLLELLDKVAVPIISYVSLTLFVPYLIAWGVLPYLGKSDKDCIGFWRWSYPAATAAFLLLHLLHSAGRALSQIHDALRDSLYLVGRRLHNLPAPAPTNT